MNKQHRTAVTASFFCATVLIFLLLAWSGKSRRNKSAQAFNDQRLSVLDSWIRARSVRLDDSFVLEYGIREIPVKGRSLITDEQYEALLETMKVGLKAFGQGGESNYINFRFPPGVPWIWKTNAAQALSNYFRIGYVWAAGAEALETQWMKKYGHPDRLMDFIPWRDYLRRDFNTPQLVQKLKTMHVEKYGPGVEFKPPEDHWQQWKIMCKDISGDTWYSNLWEHLYPTKSSIVISNYTTPPPFYDKLDFENRFSAQAEGVDSGFSNLGIVSLGSVSLIDWEESIDDIIAKNRSATIADVLLTINQYQPMPPTRFIMRMVYQTNRGSWVPYDLVDCSIPSEPRDRDVWW